MAMHGNCGIVEEDGYVKVGHTTMGAEKITFTTGDFWKVIDYLKPKKRYTMLYLIQGKLTEIPFDVWSERDELFEDIEVSEGEEGRSPTFLCIIDTETKEILEKSERLRR